MLGLIKGLLHFVDWGRWVRSQDQGASGSQVFSVWFLVGNGDMDYGDYYGGLYRDYYRDPLPHSLLSTKEFLGSPSAGF